MLCAKLLQLCLTLCNPMDCSPPGSSVYGILQTRILEWVNISYYREYFQPRDQTHISLCLLHWQAGSSPLVTWETRICGLLHVNFLHFFCP